MKADQNIDTLYAAVGRAMSAWETLEAHFSHLYSIFVGSPMEVAALEAYGRDARIFRERMTVLKKEAEVYFITSLSQTREGMFDALIDEAGRLSTARHQIAHGIVCSIPIVVGDLIQPGYAMVPPWHAAFHLTKATGQYRYSSREINSYTQQFLALGDRVARFNEMLHPTA